MTITRYTCVYMYVIYMCVYMARNTRVISNRLDVTGRFRVPPKGGPSKDT